SFTTLGTGGGQGGAWGAERGEAGGGDGQVHPDPEARGGQAVSDAGGGRVLDLGKRHGGHREDRARDHQGERRGGDRGAAAHGEDGVHGGGDVPQARRRGAGGGHRRRARE